MRRSVVLLAASEPAITESQVEQLRSLPYGVEGAPSLIVRSRHVDKIRCAGAGSSSKYGFIQGAGIIREGLWLRLRNLGSEPWSVCSINFETHVDVSKYNSIVMWVRALERRQRFFITLQDSGWKDKINPQAKSVLFPLNGLPRQKILQVVIPLDQISYSASLDFARIAKLGFQFGREVTGNADGDVIEILGIAFVDQKKLPGKILFLDPNPAKIAEKPGSPAPVFAKSKTLSRPVDIAKAPVPVARPEIKVLATPGMKLFPVERNKIKKAEALALVPGLATVSNVLKVPEIKEIRPKSYPLSPAPKKTFNPFHDSPDLPYIIVSALIVVIGSLLLIQRKKTKASLALGPIFHKLNWPLLSEGLSNSVRAEKQFWKKLSEKKISAAWVSPYQANIERDATDEHHGESFLRGQIKAALKSKVHLVPSLCFVRTIFHFEAFLANPQLYLTKTIPPSEIHLSDEELRVRYIGYFPVWIPPYWQKQQGLPQKLLLAYGKLPGIMATSDSVQFNLRSPELRQMAIRVIERFAQAGSIGVRIEGTSALLNSSLNLYWGGAFSDMGLAQDREFWVEVVQHIKSKYPDFLFIADGSGPSAQKLREFGFDYFENDHLMGILLNQIRLEEVGTLETLLAPEGSPLLSSSIMNVSPLFRSLPAGSIHRQQSMLCGMVTGFLPGVIEHDGQIPQELGKFYSLVGRWPVFRTGRFVLLPTTSPDILAFARWEKKIVYIVVANFSLNKRTGSVRLNPFVSRLDDRKLYLFSDVLHGAAGLNDLKNEINQSPAVAVLGQDLKESGLYLSMSELSLRLFSVSLSPSIQHENPSEVRQFHKA